MDPRVDTQLARQQLAALKESFASEVDGQRVTPPLVGYLFMAGYMDTMFFSTIFVWCGFQTGSFTQVSLAIAQIIESFHTNPRTNINILTTLPKRDQSSLRLLSTCVLASQRLVAWGTA
ncbi:hypothetical protein EST38_g13415 [Candolleomyces aberdarensis]|uniref:Uncharacterized protein n=1 Tax=Candolleomyces aberdarensis TaxID=2316362 RepID=A0A4Q2D006_9AGAR|nr:hypothetical protein EST38_g13415 [Candolleomyces aberdarensis]